MDHDIFIIEDIKLYIFFYLFTPRLALKNNNETGMGYGVIYGDIISQHGNEAH